MQRLWDKASSECLLVWCLSNQKKQANRGSLFFWKGDTGQLSKCKLARAETAERERETERLTDLRTFL